jgi:hypothetical protein
MNRDAPGGRGCVAASSAARRTQSDTGSVEGRPRCRRPTACSRTLVDLGLAGRRSWSSVAELAYEAGVGISLVQRLVRTALERELTYVGLAPTS